jgi:hypothetical protein
MDTIDLGSYMQPLCRYTYGGAKNRDAAVSDLGKYAVYKESSGEDRLGYFTKVSTYGDIHIKIGTWDSALMELASRSENISDCGHRETFRTGSQISLPVYYRDGLYQLYGGGSYRGVGCISWDHIESFIYHFYRLSSLSVKQDSSAVRVRQGAPTIHETIRQAANHSLHLAQLRMKGDVYYLGEAAGDYTNNVPSSVAGTVDEVVDYYEKHKDDLRTLVSLWN